MELHELATLFPPMTAEEFAGLKRNIRESEQHDPLTVHEGKILDGRNRWRACKELGIDPAITPLPKGVDPLAFVLSKNLERRHLDESKRAMIAARLANLRDGRPKKTTGENSPVSVPEAGKLLSVDKKTVSAARMVLEKGAPELVRAVEAGRVAVSAAKALVALPRKDQVAIALEPDDGEQRRRRIREAKDTARRAPKPEPPPREIALTSTTAKGKSRFYTVQEWEVLSQKERVAIIAAGFEAAAQGMNEQTGSAIEWARYSHNTVRDAFTTARIATRGTWPRSSRRSSSPSFILTAWPGQGRCKYRRRRSRTRHGATCSRIR